MRFNVIEQRRIGIVDLVMGEVGTCSNTLTLECYIWGWMALDRHLSTESCCALYHDLHGHVKYDIAPARCMSSPAGPSR